jgi:hypothetical protein
MSEHAFRLGDERGRGRRRCEAVAAARENPIAANDLIFREAISQHVKQPVEARKFVSGLKSKMARKSFYLHNHTFSTISFRSR